MDIIGTIEKAELFTVNSADSETRRRILDPAFFAYRGAGSILHAEDVQVLYLECHGELYQDSKDDFNAGKWHRVVLFNYAEGEALIVTNLFEVLENAIAEMERLLQELVVERVMKLDLYKMALEDDGHCTRVYREGKDLTTGEDFATEEEVNQDFDGEDDFAEDE